MPEAPDGLTLRRHRDLRGRENHRWLRLLLLSVLALFLVLGLANVFGQRPHTSFAQSSVITLGELAAAAREEQIPSLDDVQWAVLETSGKISFIRKPPS